MSHFSVLVVTAEQPTQDILEKALQPFHEFECTGTDDEYVQDIDITEECRTEYMESTQCKIRLPNGKLVSAYDDQFYREPTSEEQASIGPFAGTGGNGKISWASKDWYDGLGYRTKVRFVPDDCEKVEEKTKDHVPFAEWIEDYYGYKPCHHLTPPDTKGEHKYGYVILETTGEVARVIKRTNPNKTWDYWRIGGRYTGKLQPKNQFAAVQAEPSYEWKIDKVEPPKGADICQKSNLDVETMRAFNRYGREEWVNDCLKKADMTFAEFEQAIVEQRQAHEKWMTLEEPKPRGAEYCDWCENNGYLLTARITRSRIWEAPEPAVGQLLEEWIASAPVLSAFAVLKDGVWMAEGVMGWWACVSNQDEDWSTRFQRIFDSIPDDHWLTVVDCHI